MAKTTDVGLSDLASISHTLNQVSDQLSKHLADIESALGAYNLGVTAWVELSREKQPIEPGGEDPREWTVVRVLGYAKHQGRWGLLVGTYDEESNDGDFGQQQFLRDTPRETRLEATNKLPVLLKALTKQATQVAEQAAKKADMARQIAAGLGKSTR